jgi:hypothetical protein
MTTVLTRTRRIAEREGFDIIVRQHGNPVDPATNGILGGYDFVRKMKGTATIADWKAQRFQPTYPGFTCDVLRGDGTVATGQLSLDALRASYQ